MQNFIVEKNHGESTTILSKGLLLATQMTTKTNTPNNLVTGNDVTQLSASSHQ